MYRHIYVSLREFRQRVIKVITFYCPFNYLFLSFRSHFVVFIACCAVRLFVMAEARFLMYVVRAYFNTIHL